MFNMKMGSLFSIQTVQPSHIRLLASGLMFQKLSPSLCPCSTHAPYCLSAPRVSVKIFSWLWQKHNSFEDYNQLCACRETLLIWPEGGNLLKPAQPTAALLFFTTKIYCHWMWLLHSCPASAWYYDTFLWSDLKWSAKIQVEMRNPYGGSQKRMTTLHF